jgi:Mg/Co/Ni transporter MgtE
MQSLDEVLRLARELPAPERRKLLEELEKLEREETLSTKETEKAWADWVAHGPQGPMQDDGSSWP